MKSDIGHRIRTLRQDHQLKQQDLANAMQVTPQCISNWERGETYPDVYALPKLAAIFGVSTDYLLGINHPQAGEFDATVLATGMSDFITTSQRLSSKETADKMNVIFHYITDAVLKFEGIPVKYVGDGCLSFFSGTNHADRALNAALHAKDLVDNSSLVISLNSGPIYLGKIGHPNYAEKDIIGNTVNTAFIIQEAIQKHFGSRIGITDTSKKMLSDKRHVASKEPYYIDRDRERLSIWEVEA